MHCDNRGKNIGKERLEKSVTYSGMNRMNLAKRPIAHKFVSRTFMPALQSLVLIAILWRHLFTALEKN